MTQPDLFDAKSRVPMPSRLSSQCAEILHYLQEGNTITPRDALQLFGCFRLAARVYDLRQAGYSVLQERETDGKAHWAKYWLA